MTNAGEFLAMKNTTSDRKMRHLTPEQQKALDFEIFWAFLPQDERLVFQVDPEQWRALAETKIQALVDDWPNQRERDRADWELLVQSCVMTRLQQGDAPATVEEFWHKAHLCHLQAMGLEPTISVRSVIEYCLMTTLLPAAIQAGETRSIKPAITRYGLTEWANNFYVEFDSKKTFHDIISKRNLEKRYNKVRQGTCFATL